MRHLVVILGDQLSLNLSALKGFDRTQDQILMMEVSAEAHYAPHHKQKIAFILSAMRHFAKALREDGCRVRYIALDDPHNTDSFSGEVERAWHDLGPQKLILTEPGEYRVREMVAAWTTRYDGALEMRPDDRFFTSRAGFRDWAKARTSYRMEYFYREMRRRTGILMQGDKPVGGQWNFDSENRKALPKDLRPPPRYPHAIDAITKGVLTLVEHHFPDHFGTLKAFNWAVTREGALSELDHFITHRLSHFGDYQDAMSAQSPFVYHALIAPYLNIGLLDPREVCQRAEAAYAAGDAPLNAVEGFIRQILGWREYVRGLYDYLMPDYGETNALDAHRPLPEFYWSAQTPMCCMATSITNTRDHAYAHHIQRLMVTGNFALLAGLDPKAVGAWYLGVYADAFEWVELPNTHAMALFADGGVLGSKPYAASGAYIQRMSDYCSGCAFDPKVRTGPKACPFTFLYWDFLARHRERFKGNPRMALAYRNLDRMDAETLKAVRDQAQTFLDDPDGYGAPQSAQKSLFD